MGAAGPVIIFVLLMAASIAVGACVLAYVARCVLVVVQETGLGQDEVVWPDEPYVDWLSHAVVFLELTGIWVAPAALTARLLRDVWLPDQGAVRTLLLVGPGLWLFLPVGLLSSLSAQSRWVPFRLAIVHRFLRLTPAMLAFYLVTAILLGLAAAPWYYALFEQRGVLVPVAGVVGGSVILVYARLLGRVAWLVSRLPTKERVAPKAKAEERRPKRPANKPAKPRGAKKRKPAAEVQDPWAVPEEEKSRRKTKRFPWAEDPPPQSKSPAGWRPPTPDEIEGYGVAAEKPAEPEPPPEKPAKNPFYTSPEEYEPIDIQAPPDTPPEVRDEAADGWFAEQVRQRLAERTHTQPKPPPHPFFSGVYSFPFYSHCLPHTIALSLALMVLGGMFYALIGLGGQIFGWGT